ncbi:hypothetical protein ACROYT_G015748 [Oculina patagonica]
MTASTYYSGFKPAYGRLNRGSSWCTRTPSRTDEWLQVDLGQIFELCGVATQGAKRYNEWVIEFKLSYSQDGKYWTFYKDGMSFLRKGEKNTADQHKLEPIYARYIRFHPTKRYKWNCLRVEVYGTDTRISTCFSHAVGVASSSKIPDKQMTASTYYSGYKPANGRLNKAGSWCTKTPSRTDEWLQVDLGQIFEVCGVGTQGTKYYDEWVMAFKLSYSQDGKYWTTYKDENGRELEFHRNGGRNTADRHMIKPRYARYVRFYPKRRYKWNCLRVEVYGKDTSTCFSNAVGVASRNIIPDKQMKASSYWGYRCSNCVQYLPSKGRLNFDENWCALERDRNDDWLQIDFGKLFKVCGVATEGSYSGGSWVTEFRLFFSRDGRTWTTYKDEYGNDVKFHRKGADVRVDKHKLKPLSARYIRFNPIARKWMNCLRVEVYGSASGLDM